MKTCRIKITYWLKFFLPKMAVKSIYDRYIAECSAKFVNIENTSDFKKVCLA